MAPSFAEAEKIAEAFVRARQNAVSLPDYPGSQPVDLHTALAVQDAAIKMYGEPVAGWKVGRINPPWLDRLGTTRLPGPIFLSRIQSAVNGDRPVGHIFNGGFGAAEAEFVFRVGSPPKDGTTSLSLAETADLVDAVFIGIEIASSPFSGINNCGPLVTISDFGNNNGLILGDEIPDWSQSGLNEWVVDARIDGQPVGEGQASAFPDGPLGSVQYLVENLLARGITIKPGLLISTGAVTGVHEIAQNQIFEARFGDFGTISCEMACATT